MRNAIDRYEVWKPMLQGKRLGVLTHAPAVAQTYERTLDLLNRELNVVLVWGPEHGLDGIAQAGAAVSSGTDSRTGLPVHSLFGEQTAPSEEDLLSVDAVVCDVCDIGSRMYTFIYSLSDTMRACAKAHIPVYVLDRVNPLGGVRVEGIVLKKEFSSFVGRFPIPVRHGLTVGELARVFNEMFGIHCDLAVIPIQGWRREMEFEDFHSGWINPSPNMPGADCARIYNGTCLVEGTNVSEGRGTTRPFEMIGAPFIDPVHLADRLNAKPIRGITARPCRFVPAFSKHAGIPCGGIQWVITDRRTADCYEAGIRLIDVLRNDYPEFEFTDPKHFDELFGSDEFRTNAVPADPLIRRGESESRAFQDATRPFRLY